MSEFFWNNYHQVLDKSAYFRKTLTKSNKLSNQAFNLLNSILGKNVEKIKHLRKFISDLLEDIKAYGTLLEYILSEIVKWKNFEENIDVLADEISKLRNELGEDFLERAQRHLKGLSEEVIISVENTKGIQNA